MGMTTPPLETVSVGTKAPLGRSETSPELWAVGSWLSAALDDPKVCAEMKRDINEWFDGNGHHRPSPPSLVDQEGVRERMNEAIDRANNIVIRPDRDDPSLWFVIDENTAEPEVNWPGDLIAQFRSYPEAKACWKKERADEALAVMSPRIEGDA